MSQKYFCDLCGAPCESGQYPSIHNVDRSTKKAPPFSSERILVKLTTTIGVDGTGRIDLCDLCKKSILAELANK